MHFADELHARMERLRSRLVVGLDPDPERLFGPNTVFPGARPGSPDGLTLQAFCRTVVEAARTTAAAIKPQAAFFESMGLTGWETLLDTIRHAKSLGIPVILDAKRGDIGNTAKAYASAYLDPSSEFAADALTVNPFMGPDTLEPFVDKATRHGKGIFVLVKTSNPGSGAFQDILTRDGEPLWAKVAREVARLSKGSIGNSGYSNVGAVVGATYPREAELLRTLLPDSVLLLPGFGAQGARASDVKCAFHPGGKGALVSSSRAIIFAYEKVNDRPLTEDRVFEAMLQAAEEARKEIEDAVAFTPST